VSKKSAHLVSSEFSRVALAVEQDEPLNPIVISMLRAQAEVSKTGHIPYVIEQFSIGHLLTHITVN
jgi:hypothetical protein